MLNGAAYLRLLLVAQPGQGVSIDAHRVAAGASRSNYNAASKRQELEPIWIRALLVEPRGIEPLTSRGAMKDRSLDLVRLRVDSFGGPRSSSVLRAGMIAPGLLPYVDPGTRRWCR